MPEQPPTLPTPYARHDLGPPMRGGQRCQELARARPSEEASTPSGPEAPSTTAAPIELLGEAIAVLASKEERIESRIEVLTSAVDAIPRGLAESAQLMRECEGLLKKAQTVMGSIASAQEQLTELMVTEAATADKARRELWDEAARLKREIRREIRWFVRTPALLLGLMAAVFTGWLALRPRAARITPKATVGPTQQLPTPAPAARGR